MRMNLREPVSKPARDGIFARFLYALHAHPYWGWGALVVYAAAVTFPHSAVQWEVNEIQIRISLAALYRISAEIALGLGVLFTVLLLFGVRRPQSRIVPSLWFLTLAVIFGAWKCLTANNVELVHYPQYFPEGIALAALTLSPAEALSWILIFGGLDEGYQYWVLSHGRPTLLDFNDIYMDILGGAAGVVFAMAFLRCIRDPKSRQWTRAWRRPGARLVLITLAFSAVLWISGLMLLVEDKTNHRYWFALGRFQAPSFWSQVVANGPNRYHTFTPIEGMAVILITIALYAALSRHYILASGPSSKPRDLRDDT